MPIIYTYLKWLLRYLIDPGIYISPSIIIMLNISKFNPTLIVVNIVVMLFWKPLTILYLEDKKDLKPYHNFSLLYNLILILLFFINSKYLGVYLMFSFLTYYHIAGWFYMARDIVSKKPYYINLLAAGAAIPILLFAINLQNTLNSTSGELQSLISKNNGLKTEISELNNQLEYHLSNQGPENIVKDYYQLRYEYFQFNHLTGVIKVEYPNGQLYANGQFEKGEESGTWKFYHSNGQLSRKYHYKNNICGSQCCDGTTSSSVGRGTCSWHGGVCGLRYCKDKIIDY